MSNTLTKLKPVLKVVPSLPGTPGSPGRPAVPGRWTRVEKTITIAAVDVILTIPATGTNPGREVTIYAQDRIREIVRNTYGADAERFIVSVASYANTALSPNRQQLGSAVATLKITESVWVPGTPAVPPTPPTPAQIGYVSHNMNFGWNAGANSNASFDGDGQVTFNVPAGAIGVVTGLATSPDGVSYYGMTHALQFNGGQVSVMESGAVRADLGAYESSDLFAIRRTGLTVEYLKNGVRQYTSGEASSGVMFLDASLYAGGDTVDNPTIEALPPTAGAHLALQGFTMFAGEAGHGGMSAELWPLDGGGGEGDYAWAGLKLRALTLSAGRAANRGGMNGVLAKFEMPPPRSYMHGHLAPMKLLAADRPYQGMDSALTGFTLAGGGGMWEPSYCVADLSLLPILVAGNVVSGTVCRLEDQPISPGFHLLGADHAYGEVRATLAPLDGWGYGLYGNNFASAVELVIPAELNDSTKAMVVVLNEQMTVGGILVVESVLGASALEPVQLADTMELSAEIEAVLREMCWISDSAVTALFKGGVRQDASATWAVNADTSASSRYERYGFNSFARLNGVAYGAKEGGIYRLEGDDDAGEPIRASAHFGKQDFGTQHLKHVPYVYAGVSSSGGVFLRVGDGKDAFIYKVRRNHPEQRTQRFDLGKGLRASYFTFELYNENGADFELDTVRFDVVPLSRRI